MDFAVASRIMLGVLRTRVGGQGCMCVKAGGLVCVSRERIFAAVEGVDISAAAVYCRFGVGEFGVD